MKAHLTRRYWFSASHRLHNEAMSEAENLRTYGKCNNPYGHGHNYALEVTVGGQVHPATGMICNLAELDQFVEQNVLGPFGHEHLNALPQFRDVVPTTENLCVEIYDILKHGFVAAEVERIRLEETTQNAFEYAGGAPLQPVVGWGG